MKILYKKTPELSDQEIDDMQRLAKSLDDYLEDDHIRNHHVTDEQREFYLVYDNQELIGMQSYKTYHMVTPMHPRAIYVFRGYFTYKALNSGFKNITRKMSMMHMRKYLGAFWMLRPFVALAYSPNPRIYIQFKRFFPLVYPQLEVPAPEEVYQFLSALLEYGPQLTPSLFDQNSDFYAENVDITDKYKSHYRSRAPEVNKFYIKHGVFIPDGEKIALTNTSMQMVGYYNASKGIPHLLKQFLGK